MAAPASAAPIAASAISSAVIGRCGDMEGVWIEPVTAQVMMTLPLSAMCPSFRFPMSLAARALVRDERHKPPVAPELALAEVVLRQLRAPVALDGLEHLAGPVDAALHLREETLVDVLVALDIVADAAGRIEVDGLERTHERPAQRQAFADADIDILDRGVAVGDEAEGLLEQRALHAVHDEAVELALHHDRRLAGRDEEVRGSRSTTSGDVQGDGTTSAAGMR